MDARPPDPEVLDAEPDHAALAPTPTGASVRRPGPDDFDAVLDLYRRVATRAPDGTTGRGALRSERDLRGLWETSRGDAVVVEVDGLVVGYADVVEVLDPWTPALEVFAEGRVDPDHRGRGVGTFLLARAVARAERAAARADDLPTVLRTTLVDPDDGAVVWYEQRGFHAERHLLQLRVDLHEALPAPAWPDGTHPVPWQGVAPRAVHAALKEAFADHHLGVTEEYDTWRAVALEGRRVDPRATVAAVDEATGRIAGLALGRVEGPGDPGLAVVTDLGVVPAWRGRGLATAVLRGAFARLRELGATRVGLEVDDVTLDGALRLYQRAGMEVVHHTVVLARPVADATG